MVKHDSQPFPRVDRNVFISHQGFQGRKRLLLGGLGVVQPSVASLASVDVFAEFSVDHDLQNPVHLLPQCSIKLVENPNALGARDRPFSVSFDISTRSPFPRRSPWA